MVDLVGRHVHCILGLPFDAVDLETALARIRVAAHERRTCFLSTPNLNFLIAAQNDAEFRDSVIESDMSVADGMPLVWIARVLGIPLPERVAGSSVFERLATARGEVISVFFFGGPTGVAEAACLRLNATSAGLRCVGYECPGFGTVEDMSSGETLRRINASGADFVVVALGAKKGQAWIRRNRKHLAAPVVSHLGAVVNFVAGAVIRAPVLVQRLGLEWLWRIKEEPALWRRYFGDGMAFLRLCLTRVLPLAWQLRRNRPGPDDLAQATVHTIQSSDVTTVVPAGAWVDGNLDPLRACLAAVADGKQHVCLDLGRTTYVDCAFIGLLLLLRGGLQAFGSRLTLANPKPAVRRTFRYAGAEFLFELR